MKTSLSLLFSLVISFYSAQKPSVRAFYYDSINQLYQIDSKYIEVDGGLFYTRFQLKENPIALRKQTYKLRDTIINRIDVYQFIADEIRCNKSSINNLITDSTSMNNLIKTSALCKNCIHYKTILETEVYTAEYTEMILMSDIIDTTNITQHTKTFDFNKSTDWIINLDGFSGILNDSKKHRFNYDKLNRIIKQEFYISNKLDYYIVYEYD